MSKKVCRFCNLNSENCDIIIYHRMKVRKIYYNKKNNNRQKQYPIWGYFYATLNRFYPC